jgi:putative hydrolase of the HAD superfamily
VTISTVIFDFGGVISSPLFVGLGAFEEAEGYPKGSLLKLLFGETHYIGVEGRAVAAEVDEVVGVNDGSLAPPSVASLRPHGDHDEEPDWHLLEKGQLDIATYFERMSEKAPKLLGKPIDMESYGRFWRSTAPGVHWMTVHKMRELKSSGYRIGLLTNNVKEFGDNWRAMFPIVELCDDVVDSSRVGMRKPERAIYELTCERLAIKPSEAIFVDDNADNIAAAREYGMEVVHFVDPWIAIDEIDAIIERRSS